MAERNDNDPSDAACPATLRYAEPGTVSGATHVRGTLLIWAAVFVFAGFTLILPGLHGKQLNPICFLVWVVVWMPAAKTIAWETRRWRRQSGRSRGVLVAGAGLLLLGLAVGVLELVAIHYSVDPHVIVRDLNGCMRNVDAIGRGIDFYQLRHAGRFPDRLEDLLADPTAKGELTWNREKRRPATCPAEEVEMAAAVGIGAGSPYTYLGKGLGADAPPNAVVLIEAQERHRGLWVHVLLANGRPALLAPAQAAAVWAQVRAGIRPVEWPTTRAATRGAGAGAGGR